MDRVLDNKYWTRQISRLFFNPYSPTNFISASILAFSNGNRGTLEVLLPGEREKKQVRVSENRQQHGFKIKLLDSYSVIWLFWQVNHENAQITRGDLISSKRKERFFVVVTYAFANILGFGAIVWGIKNKVHREGWGWGWRLIIFSHPVIRATQESLGRDRWEKLRVFPWSRDAGKFCHNGDKKNWNDRILLEIHSNVKANIKFLEF